MKAASGEPILGKPDVGIISEVFELPNRDVFSCGQIAVAFGRRDRSIFRKRRA